MRTDDLVVLGSEGLTEELAAQVSEAVAGAAEGEDLLAQKATDIQV